jgi:Holliday junction DNA helicase RuvA
VIGALRGTIIERQPAGDTAVELVVDVGGVGYRVTVSPRTAAALDGLGQEASLAVHTHVREGSITLYGFTDPDERRAFELLLSAHGVGPALALSVVAVHRPAELAEIVIAGDTTALCLVPGVGKKTAARLLLDLRARFEQFDGPLGAMAVLDGGSPTGSSGRASERADVSEALAQLGYGQEEIRAALRALPGDGPAEQLLRSALRELAPRR